MRKIISRLISYCALIVLFSGISSSSFAQGQGGRDFGFGLILGDPTGGTVKFWLNKENAIVGDIGADYFGAPRIDIDYLWHFYSFRSTVTSIYAGIGGVVGVGQGYYALWYRDDHNRFYYRGVDGQTGFGARAIFGLNILPRRTPLEFFVEIGPLIGISPAFGVALDFAAGIRFYP
jgi:hypothetical protein